MEPAVSHFVDRAEAGRLLARRLSDLKTKRPVVYALPRGGVPVGLEIAPLIDRVECLIPARRFHGVGGYYDDFHQLSDKETVDLVERYWAETDRNDPSRPTGA